MQSYECEDEVVRSLDEIGVGDVVEVGTDEPRRVTSAITEPAAAS